MRNKSAIGILSSFLPAINDYVLDRVVVANVGLEDQVGVD